MQSFWRDLRENLTNFAAIMEFLTVERQDMCLLLKKKVSVQMGLGRN